MSIVWLAYSVGAVLTVMSIREVGIRFIEGLYSRRARSFKPVVLDLTAYKHKRHRRLS